MAYDTETGVFRWLEYRYPRRPDLVVGFMNDEGYLKTKIGRRTYALHRLAWLYVHGSMPSAQIDHINGNRADNRIGNLRLATQGQNRTNSATNRDNAIGVRGVRKKKGTSRFEARITHNGRQIFLGTFPSLEEAVAARKDAERLYHQEFAPNRD